MNNSKQKHLLLPFIILFFFSVFGITSTHAQHIITGNIFDAMDNTSLIGASVTIKGTSIGTVTDIDGNYSIDIKSDSDTLIFSYVGYLTEEAPVNGQSSIHISLSPDFSEIEEIVVVGYGTQKKSDLTGAVSIVGQKDLEKSNATSMSKALQGRAAGVTIMSTSGQPGADMNIRVRGVGSINNEAQPIVVIDGVISTTNDLGNLNPQDIESLSILKDAASAAIYGAQSSNGVILVTTKKGESGEPSVSFSMQIGLSNMPKQMDVMNSDQYVDFYESAYQAHNERFKDYPSLIRPIRPAYSDSVRAANGYTNSDWQDLITVKNALSQNYNLTVSGGNDKATYLLSGTFLNDGGVLLNTSRKMTTFRVNTSLKVGKRITIGENLSFSVSKTQSDYSVQSPWLISTVASPLMPIYDEDSEKGYMGPTTDITGSNDRTNPYAELMLRESLDNFNRFFGNIYAEIDIIKGLKFKSLLGVNYFNKMDTRWIPMYDLGDSRSEPIASWSVRPEFFTKWQWDNTLNYNKSIGNHNFNLLIGTSAVSEMRNSISTTAQNYQFENLRTLTNGNPANALPPQQTITPSTFFSTFGRITYDYKGKYLFTGTLRQDGSSKFAKEYNTGTFPAMSVGWKLNEDFLPNVSSINVLKLRFGWGKSGNVPDANFLYSQTLSGYDAHAYSFGYDEKVVHGVGPLYNFGSPLLQWEEAVMTNIGLDFVAYNNKLQFTTEYYRKNYNKLITEMPLKYIFGLSTLDAAPPMYNFGDMQNSGFEFSAIWKKSEGEFNYRVSANLTTVKNEITSLKTNGEIHNNTTTTLMGLPVGTYYGYVADGILQISDFKTDDAGNLVYGADGGYIIKQAKQEPLTGPGDIKFKDLNGDGKINDLDRTVIGKSIPDFTYGLNFDCSYHNFDLNIFFQGVQGNEVYNNYRSRGVLAAGNNEGKDENRLVEANNYWTPENPINDQTGIGLNDYNNNARFSTWWLEDASFLRLKNLQLGYTLPSSIIKRVNMSRLRIYVGGENLFVITKYKGYDPEVTSSNILKGNVDYGKYPTPRVIIFGLNAKF